jgi:hypothetical protein
LPAVSAADQQIANVSCQYRLVMTSYCKPSVMMPLD